MAEAVELYLRSANPRRVVVPNSTDFPFPVVVPTADPPTKDSSAALTDGTNGAWFVGGDGVAHPLLWLQPLALAPAGAQFSLQVWGFRHVMDGQNNSQNAFVPAFLCELACTTGEVPGVENGSLLATERLCDTITLAAGTLGPQGEICSPGSDPTGLRPNLPGWAVVNLRGSRFFRVVFQQTDPVAMNALFAPLSY